MEKSTLHSAKIITESKSHGAGKEKQKQSRASAKIFSFTLQGLVAIIIVTGVLGFTEDPVWAITCVAIGAPVLLLGFFELFKKKDIKK